MAEGIEVLETARHDLGVSVADLWCDYFALGGMGTPLEVDAFLNGALVVPIPDRDLLAVALNERIAKAGGDHPLAYDGDLPD